MSRPVRLVFLSLACFFLLFPLAVPRPGMPPTLKADEPAYYLMAMSLVKDGDLVCDRGDLRRLFDAYPHLPVENLILKSDDGWKTVHFGKPYLYSLLAAPMAGMFGARGMVAFNMALLLAMVWMGYSHLRRRNDEWLAAVFSALFFFLSPVFVYVFWIQPEILNMFGIAACLYLGFSHSNGSPAGEDESRLRGSRVIRALFGETARPVWSAAALALAVYNKPMFAILGIPVLWHLWRRRSWKAATAWVLAAVVAMGAIAGLSIAWTGKPSAYLGSARAGIKIDDPERFDELIAPLARRTYRAEQREDLPPASYSWLFRIPKLFPSLLKENLGYFLWGRHTGLLLYMPFALVAVLFFLINDRRSVDRWLLVAALAGVAFFFLIWIHYNWHGGSGFVGNRYYASVYPAFLFLVGRIRPAGLIAAGAVAAGLFLAPILFTPYGAPVPDPTLQFHARSSLFERFPVELSLRHHLPGYEGMTAHGVTFRARKDLVEVPDTGSGSMWVRGAASTEIWATSAQPLTSLVFDVTSPSPQNRIDLELGGERHRIEFDEPETESADRELVEFRPRSESKLWYQYDKKIHGYRLVVSSRTGRNPRRSDGEVIQPQFYVGGQLTYLGSREQLTRKARFRLAWAETDPLPVVTAGERFSVTTALQNLSGETWPVTGSLPVKIAHRWLDASGREIEVGDLTPLERRVTPRSWTQAVVEVRAPAQEGAYILELDAVREGLSRFSERGAPTLRLEVTVALTPSS